MKRPRILDITHHKEAAKLFALVEPEKHPLNFFLVLIAARGEMKTTGTVCEKYHVLIYIVLDVL